MALSVNVKFSDNVDQLTAHLREGINVFAATSAAAEKMAQTLSGDKLLRAANLYAQGLEKIGDAGGVVAGAERLISGERDRGNALLDKAIAKYDALGQAAPSAMLAASAAMKNTREETDRFGHTMEALALPTGHAGELFEHFASTLENPRAGATKLAAALAGDLTAGLGGVGAVAAGAGAALISVGVAAFELVEKAAALGGKLNDLSDKTGMSVPALSRFSNAAIVAGTDVNQITDSVFKLEQQIGNDAPKVAKGLDLIGLSLDDIKKMSPDQMFTTITAALAGTEDATIRNAAGADIFGKGYRELAPLVMKLNEALEITASITPFTDAEAKAAEEFEMRVKALKLQFDQLEISAGRALLPTMKDMVAVLPDVANRFAKGADDGHLFDLMLRGLAEQATTASMALDLLFHDRPPLPALPSVGGVAIGGDESGESAATKRARLAAKAHDDALAPANLVKNLPIAEPIALPLTTAADAQRDLAADYSKIEAAQRKATAAADALAKAWENLNSLGRTYDETLAGLSPTIREQATYYAALGATVADLEKAFPSLTQAQAAALVAGAKDLKTYSAAWENLNSLGQTTGDTLAGLNPTIREQASYYASLGATVADLAKAFPDLTQAQAAALVAGAKDLTTYSAAWQNLNSLGATTADTLAGIAPTIREQASYYASLGATVADLAKAFPDLTQAQAAALVTSTKDLKAYVKAWQQTEDDIAKLWDKAAAINDASGLKGLALQKANIDKATQLRKDDFQQQIDAGTKFEEQRWAADAAADAVGEAEKTAAEAAWALKRNALLLSLDVQDQKVREQLHGRTLASALAENQAELAAYKAKLDAEGLLDAAAAARAEQLYADKAELTKKAFAVQTFDAISGMATSLLSIAPVDSELGKIIQQLNGVTTSATAAAKAFIQFGNSAQSGLAGVELFVSAVQFLINQGREQDAEEAARQAKRAELVKGWSTTLTSPNRSQIDPVFLTEIDHLADSLRLLDEQLRLNGDTTTHWSRDFVKAMQAAQNASAHPSLMSQTNLAGQTDAQIASMAAYYQNVLKAAIDVNQRLADMGGLAHATAADLADAKEQAQFLFVGIAMGGRIGNDSLSALNTLVGSFGQAAIDSKGLVDQWFLDMAAQAKAAGIQLDSVSKFFDTMNTKLASGLKAGVSKLPTADAEGKTLFEGYDATQQAALQKAYAARQKADSAYKDSFETFTLQEAQRAIVHTAANHKIADNEAELADLKKQQLVAFGAFEKQILAQRIADNLKAHGVLVADAATSTNELTVISDGAAAKLAANEQESADLTKRLAGEMSAADRTRLTARVAELADQHPGLQKEAATDLTATQAQWQTSFDRMSRIAMASFRDLIAQGKSPVEAIAAIGDSLDILADRQQKLGLHSNAAFDNLNRLRTLVTGNQELVDSVAGLNDVMVALANTGGLDADTFKDLQAEGVQSFAQLTAAGFSTREAENQLAPLLQNIIKLHKEKGYAIDEATQKLIDQATADGELSGVQMTHAEEYQATQDTLRDGLGAIITALGGQLPEAWKKAIDATTAAGDKIAGVFDGLPNAAKDAATGISDELSKIKTPNITIKAVLTRDGDAGDGAATGGIVETHGIRHFASGGPVGTDTVKAWLTPGEGVITTSGMSALESLNRGSLAGLLAPMQGVIDDVTRAALSAATATSGAIDQITIALRAAAGAKGDDGTRHAFDYHLVAPPVPLPGRDAVFTDDQLKAGTTTTSANGRGNTVVLQESFTFQVTLPPGGIANPDYVEKELMPQIVTQIEDHRRGYTARIQRALA